jgi:hypothetical protein
VTVILRRMPSPCWPDVLDLADHLGELAAGLGVHVHLGDLGAVVGDRERGRPGVQRGVGDLAGVVLRADGDRGAGPGRPGVVPAPGEGQPGDRERDGREEADGQGERGHAEAPEGRVDEETNG